MPTHLKAWEKVLYVLAGMLLINSTSRKVENNHMKQYSSLERAILGGRVAGRSGGMDTGHKDTLSMQVYEIR